MALAVSAPCAWAQASHSLREALTRSQGNDGRRHTEAPPIARYVSESGSRFVVDRTGPDVLFKFDHSPEIWVLKQKPAPGGDVIYVNDVGDPVLRASRFGGLTLYSQERPMGAPAALQGASPGFKPAQMSPQALFAKLQWASVQASEAAGRLIVFDADEITPGSEPLVADTAAVVAAAFQRLKRVQGGPRVLQRLRTVRIAEGRAPSVELRPSGVLDVVIAPSRGLAGRPSSGRVIQAAFEG
jgi:hypothetical protein